MRWGLLVVAVALNSTAFAAELRDLRVWAGPESTRVVFDLDAPAKHEMFTLSGPERVVIDIQGLGAAARARVESTAGQGVVQRLRSGPRKNGVRIVLDVSDRVFATSFALPPDAGTGHRLVVDLAHPDAPPAAAEVATPAVVQAAPAPVPEPQISLRSRPVVIAIDAGHGGQDPGAKGRSGLLEKNVALTVSRKLAKLINDTPNMRAVLTRDGDYFLGLRERVNIARKHQADLFVSVHCNAFTRRDMRGSAVYVLSNGGATSEHARWLAQKENASDLVGGVHLHDKDNELAAVLIDLSQGATMEASFDVGSRILGSLSKINRLQKREIQQAGFAVLKAPDIPSVLVETAFISNAEEEKMLGSGAFQDKLARQIFAGVKGYFESYRPQQQVVEAEPELQYVSRNSAAQGELHETSFTQGVSR
ncbi:N-acetylmuramoyl-L-alanine amidase [Sinimarinibacterium flocculans]|uniref:N-acetylmuramoyl-L-alanine amidase AmiC n=1 Tax=Sinimarinibacterium flocculans TaxID=985250 RepID=A0A318EJN9_9GAMM|nr:N-acetylmuramoyl-L-alanine amidase [Sinimarinibacterium flocculans]PXV71102.1 N-acetylmuramoyl-L-alanine amidase [Sinimarinibacterium flocculans]